LRLVYLELIFVVLKTQFDAKLSLNSISVELQSDAADKKVERRPGRRAYRHGKDDVDENRARPPGSALTKEEAPRILVQIQQFSVGVCPNPLGKRVEPATLNAMEENEIGIFKSEDGEAEVKVRFDRETCWLSLNEISALFGRDKSVISRHIKGIFGSGELDRTSTVAKNATVQSEGGRAVNRELEVYNLDVIISVGYRVNSIRGTQFRQWATKRLKQYLLQGIAINERRLLEKNEEIQTLHDGIRILSRAIENRVQDDQGSDWLSSFRQGLQLLDDYDHEKLDRAGQHTQVVLYPDYEEYESVIDGMRKEFDSAVFGQMRDSGFLSALGQIQQGFNGQDLYTSIEEKAAVLLYLVVKNHAFVDGNKRIAAASFLLFLRKNNLLYTNRGLPIISQDALASLTLFVAASKPDEMDAVKRLLISVLNRNA
jgi:prophage maintenance system killer protein